MRTARAVFLLCAVIITVIGAPAAYSSQVYSQVVDPADSTGASGYGTDDDDENLPYRIEEVLPAYPEQAERAGLEGTVVVSVLVTEQGDVEKAEVIKGPDVFHDVSLNAARATKFKPAKREGIPVASLVYLSFIFVWGDEQAGTRTPGPPEPKLGEMSFRQNDRVLTWRTMNTVRIHPADRVTINVDSNLSSSLNQATGSAYKDRWYDSVFNQAGLDYRLSEELILGVSAREDWNRDTLSKYGKSLLTTNVDGTVKYRPSRDLGITGGIGRLYDRRFENEDEGTSVNGKVVYDGNPYRNVYTTVNVGGTTSTLKRSNDRLRLRSDIVYTHRLANIALGFEDSRRSRGYYSDIGERKNIEERDRIEQNLTLLLARGSFMNARKKTAMAIDIGLGKKRVDDSANNLRESSKYRKNSRGTIRDFNLRIARGLARRVLADVTAGYVRNDNAVENSRYSRTQTDVSLRGRMGIGIGRADSVSVNGWIKRTRIDTPAAILNDRDELKYETGIHHSHRFTNNFQTGLDFRVLETHYVNIDASQSSQNKWIKTYQFSPSLVYTPARAARVRHTVNVYANSMDYDFETGAVLRSNITRRVSSETWVDTAISPRTRIILGFMFEENDYGSLDGEGRKLPIEEGIRRFGNISIEYAVAEWVVVTPVYEYKIRRDTNVDLHRLIRREVDQTYGMKCELFQDEHGEYAVVISARRIIRKTEKYPVRIRDYITLTMKYEF